MFSLFPLQMEEEEEGRQKRGGGSVGFCSAPSGTRFTEPAGVKTQHAGGVGSVDTLPESGSEPPDSAWRNLSGPSETARLGPSRA